MRALPLSPRGDFPDLPQPKARRIMALRGHDGGAGIRLHRAVPDLYPSPMRRLSRLLALAVFPALASCSGGAEGGTAPDPQPATITLEAPAPASSLGDTISVQAQVRDARGTPLPGVALAWTSNAPGVLRPLGNGRFEAVGNGDATLEARLVDGGLRATAQGRVEQVAATVEVTPPLARMTGLAGSVSMKARALDARGHAVAGRVFSWLVTGPVIVASAAGDVAEVRPVDFGTGVVTAATGGRTGAASVIVQPQVATAIERLAGDEQTGYVGQPLSAPFRVRVVDAESKPIPGARVAWEDARGTYPRATDSNGIAEMPWSFPVEPGRYTVTVRVVDQPGVAATFSATAQVGPLWGLQVVKLPSRYPAPDAFFEQPPVVRLVDPYGHPMAVKGVPVAARASCFLDGEVTQTDALGIASFPSLRVRSLGPVVCYLTFVSAGLQSAEGDVVLAGHSPLTIEPTPPALLARAGESVTVSVAVRDGFGVPVWGLRIDFTTSLAAQGERVTTDFGGVARFAFAIRADAKAGAYEVTARSADFRPAVFSVTIIP